MFRIILLIIALIPLSSSIAFSEQIHLDDDLTVEPAAALELSFDIIPDYDANKKVLISKTGEKLQYFISVRKLPQGEISAGKYFTQMLGELSASSEEASVELMEQGQYKTETGVSGSYIEYVFKPNGSDRSHQQIAHYLTSGGRSFVAIATLIEKRVGSQMHVDSIKLFRTAAIASAAVQ